MCRDPKCRPAAKEALQDPWLRGNSLERNQGQPLDATVVQRIQVIHGLPFLLILPALLLAIHAILHVHCLKPTLLALTPGFACTLQRVVDLIVDGIIVAEKRCCYGYGKAHLWFPD